MGQCICKKQTNDAIEGTSRRNLTRAFRRGSSAYDEQATSVSVSDFRRSFPGGSSDSTYSYSQQLTHNLCVDIRDLILETLNVIRTLVNNEQEPPAAMLKLNMIADREVGWLQIVYCMLDIIPFANPLGPAVITLFLDESPLPTKETVAKLLFKLNLNSNLSKASSRPPIWHRNLCIVLGCIAEKLAGPNSVATFKPSTLEYLLENLRADQHPAVILFALIALEKYAQTSENKSTISNRLAQHSSPNQLQILEGWLNSGDYLRHQVGFCAQHALDNIFVKPDRLFSHETINTDGINVMLNHMDVSEYLKISPNGLEARCDVSSFESVRCTFSVNSGCWYYEALIITPGVMQIGWATKHSKFLNHDGYGIGDDEYSVAYDGCRQLLWHNATSQPNSHLAWKPGDILGCLLNVDLKQVVFYLNGEPLHKPHTEVFESARNGFFAAASFMSFQHCRFNFGHEPFAFLSMIKDFAGVIQNFNDFGQLTSEQRQILPKHKKLELLRVTTLDENACTICASNPATIVLKPCNHSGFCSVCAMVVEQCPLCRSAISVRQEVVNNELVINNLQVGSIESKNISETALPISSLRMHGNLIRRRSGAVQHNAANDELADVS